MNIVISWQNEANSITVPVPPPTFELNGSQNNTSLIVHNLGEVNLKGKRNLNTFAFSSFFPCQHYDFCVTTPDTPQNYVNTFRKLLEDNETLHLIVEGTTINMFCTLEDFTTSVGESAGDIDYSMTLKEYRQLQIKESSKKDGIKLPGGKRNKKAVKTQSYTWKKGDTFSSVAKKITGNSANAKAIKKQNEKLIATVKKGSKDSNKKLTALLVGCKVVIKV